MFKLQNFLKRYVWDPETTPYFTGISKLSRSQADSELFFFAIMASVLFGVATFTSITGQAPYGVSKVAAIYCFTIVSAVVLVGTVKNIYAAYYAASAPLAVLGAIFLYGFPVKMELIDELVLLVIIICTARYMWRVITMCRVYSILPHRTPEHQTRRRLF
jgi:hypothetical protein